MPTRLEYHVAILDSSSCIPFPLSLKVHPFHHLPLMNAMIFHIRCYSTEISLTHQGCVDRGFGRSDARPQWVSRIQTCTLTAQLSLFAAQVSTFSKCWVRNTIRGADVVAVRPHRVSCRSRTPSEIPTNWSRRLTFHSHARIQSSQMHPRLHPSESELVHELPGEGFDE